VALSGPGLPRIVPAWAGPAAGPWPLPGPRHETVKRHHPDAARTARAGGIR